MLLMEIFCFLMLDYCEGCFDGLAAKGKLWDVNLCEGTGQELISRVAAR